MTANPAWTRRLARLRRELGAELAQLEPLRELAERRDDLDELLEDLDHQLERASAAGVVLLVGSTGAGKSTMLNALAGRDIATEGVSRPTTAVPTVYAPEDADLAPLLVHLSGPAPAVVRHPGGGGRSTWCDQVLIDAPDVNSIATEHRATVRALAERADVLLVVLHRQSIVEQSAVQFLEDYAHRRRLVFALNRADELTDEARAKLTAQIDGLARERLGVDGPLVFAVSARAAKEGRGSDEWRGLLAELERLVEGGALATVRRHNAIGAAGELAGLLSDVEREVSIDLAEVGDATREGLEAVCVRAHEEVAHRLGLRRAELSNLLLAEAGKRWDGPGGWSLRIGAWSAMGAGLGLALARRNPLAAAGLAAGGAAIGKVREERGRKHLQESLGLLPEPGDLRAAYTEALGPARLRAGRLVGEPAELGVPSHEAVAAALDTAVGESWNRLMHRDVPEVAERSAPAWLRWPLDLPVYALGAWILYRAGEGFFTQSYVGLDFLLNGLLLAVALLFLLRLVVRTAVAGRARGLIRSTSERVRGRLLEDARELAREAEQRSERIARALEHGGRLGARWKHELARGDEPPRDEAGAA